MKREKLAPPTSSRRTFAKSLLPTVFALHLANAPAAEAQQNRQTPPRGKRFRQTSPITVGGGGGGRPGTSGSLMVTISFAESAYKETKPNEFLNSKGKLHKLWITDHWGKKKHYPVRRSFTIHCIREGDQHDSRIYVRANPLKVSFDKSVYKYEEDKEVYICYDRRITTIYIDGNIKPAFTATNGICNIDIDDEC